MSHFETHPLGWRGSLAPALALWWLAAPAAAEQPRFYNLEGFGSWLDGNPESTAVTEDGEIVLPSPNRVRFEDPAASFSAAAAWGDDIVVANVEDGKVMAIDRAGKSRELFTADDFVRTLKTTLDSSLSFQKDYQAFVEATLKGTPIVTRTEIDQVHEELYLLKRQIREVRDLVKELGEKRNG